MPGKVGKLPIQIAFENIVTILRKEGPKKKKFLRERISCGNTTFNRALESLTDTGIVVERKGYLYWHEDTSIPGLRPNNRLKHDMKIVQGLLGLIPGENWLETEIKPDPNFREQALSHLKTGYPVLYSQYEAYQTSLQKLDQIQQKPDYPKSDQIQSAEKQYSVSLRNLAHQIEQLEKTVHAGKPLAGRCNICH